MLKRSTCLHLIVIFLGVMISSCGDAEFSTREKDNPSNTNNIVNGNTPDNNNKGVQTGPNGTINPGGYPNYPNHNIGNSFWNSNPISNYISGIFTGNNPGAYPPGTYPPGSYPPGSYPPGAYPPGGVPPGSYPPGYFPPPGGSPCVGGVPCGNPTPCGGGVPCDSPCGGGVPCGGPCDGCDIVGGVIDWVASWFGPCIC